ncbi:MAG TPA: PHB depolymerase family esterase [Thermoanaerobaculia bacterium]|nr:PHB depolymerase family esterase [Thermoanaerobaculia bacterium]
MARSVRVGEAVGAAANFQPRSLSMRGKVHRYAVYVPPGYDRTAAWPAVLSLHGAGERGNDGTAQTTVGIGPALARLSRPFPAIVVLPQCPRNDYWSMGAGRIAMRALDEVEQEFRIDPRRVALTGVSMGGAGAWRLAAEHPDRFAALAPICGWAYEDAESVANRVRAIRTWIFHGDADEIVPVEASRAMADALKALGAEVRYTELPGVAHNSWDDAYQKSELLEWLISP